MERSPNRAHDRSSFFKYMSGDTVRSVLTNRTLRWSSPLLFNDPFDVPRELSFGLSPSVIIEALGHRMTALIEHPPDDTSELVPNLRLIVEKVKNGISPELKAEILAGVEDSAASHRPTGESMDDFREFWRKLLPNLRILCFTESPDHLAMWFHYADKYRGAVLEFKCDDDLDSAWLAAQPVTYPETKPEVYTADGWAELFTTQQELAIERILHVSTYTKSPDWSYEKEWRVVSTKRPTDTGNFTDYKFHLAELVGIYFGPLASQSDKDALLAAATPYPKAHVFEVTIGITRDLLFNEIRG